VITFDQFYKWIWGLQVTGTPGILVETGFITNKEQEEYMNSDEGRWNGLKYCECIKEIQSSVGIYKGNCI
jgi:hypothetical protein